MLNGILTGGTGFVPMLPGKIDLERSQAACEPSTKTKGRNT